ncbi:MAG: hypothetical protein AAF310_05580, partial [Myxococcota bacterium]
FDSTTVRLQRSARRCVGHVRLARHLTLQRAQHKQIVVLELKLIHQKSSPAIKQSEGLKQTAAYMQRVNTQEGHLLLFDRRADKSWDERIWIKHEKAPDGRAITVWGL